MYSDIMTIVILKLFYLLTSRVGSASAWLDLF